MQDLSEYLLCRWLNSRTWLPIFIFSEYFWIFMANLHDFKMSLFYTNQVIILIGNKADLEAQRDVTYEEAKQFAEENGAFLPGF